MSTDFQLQELRLGLDNFTDSTKMTFDYQFIANPGYNADRAPVNVFAGRFHTAFSGRSSQKFLMSRWEHRNGGALAWGLSADAAYGDQAVATDRIACQPTLRLRIELFTLNRD